MDEESIASLSGVVDIVVIVTSLEVVDEVAYPITKMWRGECEARYVSAALRGIAPHTIDGLMSIMKSRDPKF